MQLVWSYGILLTLTGCVSSGQGIGGPGTYTYTDVLKPHGHERGEAAEQYATRICDQGNSDLIATPAFNACMRARGWKLTHYEPAQPATYIDPQTGMECHNTGLVAICDPPHGTVYYLDEEGLSCRRSGLVEICAGGLF